MSLDKDIIGRKRERERDREWGREREREREGKQGNEDFRFLSGNENGISGFIFCHLGSLQLRQKISRLHISNDRIHFENFFIQLEEKSHFCGLKLIEKNIY